MSKTRWRTISTHLTHAEAAADLGCWKAQAARNAASVHDERCKRRIKHHELAGLPAPNMPDAILPTRSRMKSLGDTFFCVQVETT